MSVIIFGATGGIGNAFANYFRSHYPNLTLHLVSKSAEKIDLSLYNKNTFIHPITHNLESSLEHLHSKISTDSPIQFCINAIGALYGEKFQPEKKISQLHTDQFQWSFYTNTIIPALIIKHFSSLMAKDKPSIMAHLSAKIGSISDNRLGGWYSYRCSKAALNMLIKTTAIEMKRLNPFFSIVGLHPGTVRTSLSRPFTHSSNKTIFTPEESVEQLFKNVLSSISTDDSGKLFSYSGDEILP